MKLNSKTIKLLVIFIFVNLIPIQLSQSATLVDTLYSYPNTKPVLDGLLTDAEWQDAKEIEITLYDIDHLTNTVEISLMSTYNITEGTISFGVTINNTEFLALFLIFKTNTSDDLIRKNAFWGYGKNHDVKYVLSSTNTSYDTFTGDFLLPIMSYDEDLGGTNDTEGKCQMTSELYTVELTTSLNSGDELGYDFNLAENSQIEFTLVMWDGRLTYSPIRLDDNDYDYYILNVGKENPLGLSTFFIVGSLVTSIAVVSLLSRKRKNSSNK